MNALLNARAALLGVLDDPGHGLELIERVKARTRGHVRLNQGSVYPALRQLERAGLVRSWKGRSSRSGGRPRTYYELTIKGVKASSRLKETLDGLVHAPPDPVTSSREIAQMKERLRRCADVSAFCIELRRAMQRHQAS